jgi:hypothetical protein
MIASVSYASPAFTDSTFTGAFSFLIQSSLARFNALRRPRLPKRPLTKRRCC